MFRALVALAIAASSVVIASPTPAGYSPFPLADGFPAPSASQLKQIERLAGGSLPNGALPSELTDAATVTLQLIALNEIFEVAYFTSFLEHVTNGDKGYKMSSSERKRLIEILTAVKNQEELHALGANGILANAGKQTIKPCRYNFPVTDYASSVAFAETFTNVVLSVLPLAQETFGSDGGDELGLVGLVGSIIAQEGEQTGFYRYAQGKNPSAAPFLTTPNPAFAFTALQQFIVPGSCPSSIAPIAKAIPTFAGLNVVSTKVQPQDSVVTFSVSGKLDSKMHELVYLTGQLLPVNVKISNVKYSKGVTTFTAPFPFASQGFSKGLTVAAVVDACDKKFASAAAVAAATKFGPGLLEVQ